jgi:hypothetical protein
MWAKPYKADPKYHYWSIMVGLDEANVALYKQTGLKGKLKDEGDSHAWAKFTRPESKVIKGELRDFDPPTVTYNGEPFKKLIGNGSIVKCVVQVYDYEYQKKKGVGQRLESIEIVDLVPYGDDSGSEAFSTAAQPIRAVLPPQ